MPADQQLNEVLFAYGRYVEEQQAVLDTRDYYRAEELEAMRVQEYWDGMIAE